jgi:toxin YoeB
MRSLVFEGNTWDAYEKLREKDKKLHKAFCKILKEMLRSEDPSKGIGKPEPLKHNLSGLCSRRISQRDRLIYRFDDKSIYVFAIGGHYDQPPR